jgi:hypothetical protein
MFCRWLSTVRTDSTRRSAISRLEAPAAAIAAISCSRRVSRHVVPPGDSPGVRASPQLAAASAARRVIAVTDLAWPPDR